MSAPRRDGKPIVLIAEDDLDDRFLLEMSFRDFEDSLEVKFVQDGGELMEYLRGQEARSHVGLILLDLNMPKIDGWQALREIKGRADLKGIPIVIWTTSNEQEDKIFCAEAGAADFVTKPVNYLDVDSAIKKIVGTWLTLPIPSQAEGDKP
jgi:two-component system response regulator